MHWCSLVAVSVSSSPPTREVKGYLLIVMRWPEWTVEQASSFIDARDERLRGMLFTWCYEHAAGREREQRQSIDFTITLTLGAYLSLYLSAKEEHEEAEIASLSLSLCSSSLMVIRRDHLNCTRHTDASDSWFVRVFVHSFSLIQVNHLSTSEKINWHKQLSVSSLWPSVRGMRMLVSATLSRTRVPDDTLRDQKAMRSTVTLALGEQL